MVKHNKRRRVTILNLDHSKLDINLMEEIALIIEEEIRRQLDKRIPLGRSYDADIIVSVENKGGEIEISLDIGVLGALDDVIDYDAIVQGVIKEVSSFIEELLRKRVGRNSQ